MPDKIMKYGKDNTIQFDKGRPFVIICEGEDDSHFLREYLCHIAKGAQIDEA